MRRWLRRSGTGRRGRSGGNSSSAGGAGERERERERASVFFLLDSRGRRPYRRETPAARYLSFSAQRPLRPILSTLAPTMGGGPLSRHGAISSADGRFIVAPAGNCVRAYAAPAAEARGGTASLALVLAGHSGEVTAVCRDPQNDAQVRGMTSARVGAVAIGSGAAREGCVFTRRALPPAPCVRRLAAFASSLARRAPPLRSPRPTSTTGGCGLDEIRNPPVAAKMPSEGPVASLSSLTSPFSILLRSSPPPSTAPSAPGTSPPRRAWMCSTWAAPSRPASSRRHRRARAARASPSSPSPGAGRTERRPALPPPPPPRLQAAWSA